MTPDQRLPATPPPTAPARAPGQRSGGRTILVVDDSSALRTLLRLTLTGAGYRVIEAGDGITALEQLELAGQVHLVVCDVNMPRMNGPDFVARLKQHPRHRFMPVVMLTTESQAAQQGPSLASTARAWIVKPFNPPQLLDAVGKLVHS